MSVTLPGRGTSLTHDVVGTLGQTRHGLVNTLHCVLSFKILRVLEFLLLKVCEVADQQQQQQQLGWGQKCRPSCPDLLNLNVHWVKFPSVL